MFKLAPSILSADFSKLGEEVAKIESAGAHLVHVDVMDGHFVPNISYGATVMKSLNKVTKVPYDVHLMIENPDTYLEDFVTDNTEYISVHVEACKHVHRTIGHIKSTGVKAGLAINPGTSLTTLEWVLEDVDMVLLMSVNPGFGGQKFIPSTVKKVAELAKMRQELGLNFEIEVDGGINLANVKSVTDAGANITVAGSSVFGAEDVEKRVGEFLALYR